MNKDAAVIKKLAELGYDVAPKEQTPELEELRKRVEDFEKEMGHKLDPADLGKYLG